MKRLSMPLFCLQVSPFIEVQASGGGKACMAADVERAFGKTAACSAVPVTLQRTGSHLVIKVSHDKIS